MHVVESCAFPSDFTSGCGVTFAGHFSLLMADAPDSTDDTAVTSTTSIRTSNLFAALLAEDIDIDIENANANANANANDSLGPNDILDPHPMSVSSQSLFEDVEKKPTLSPTTTTTISFNNKKPSGTKKKKKSKMKNMEKHTRARTLTLDELDKSLEHSHKDETEILQTERNSTNTFQCLRCTVEKLDMKNEVRKKYKLTLPGKKVRWRNGMGMAMGRMKKTILVRPGGSDVADAIRWWPTPTSSGIFMICEQKKNMQTSYEEQEEKTFTYKWSKAFEKIQQHYMEVVASYDPQQLMEFIAQYPYHPDGNMAVAQLMQAQGEPEKAALMVERALYTLETAWHSEFKIDGYARMTYQVHENKPLFHALHAHAIQMSRRGCPATALEVAKLLLALSPLSDDTAILVNIDYFALRAEQYEWLINFAGQLDRALVHSKSKPWQHLLPQYASEQRSSATACTHRSPTSMTVSYVYSCALARLRLAKNSETLIAENVEIITPPVFPPLPSEHISADYALQRAIAFFPEVLPELLKFSGNEKELLRDPWSTLIDSLCAPYRGSFSPWLEKLTRIYGERCGALWKSNETMEWLLKNAQRVEDMLLSDRVDVAGFRLLRRAIYSGVTPQPISELQKSSYTDDVQRIPPEMLMAQQYEMLDQHTENPQQQHAPVGNLRELVRGIVNDAGRNFQQAVRPIMGSMSIREAITNVLSVLNGRGVRFENEDDAVNAVLQVVAQADADADAVHPHETNRNSNDGHNTDSQQPLLQEIDVDEAAIAAVIAEDFETEEEIEIL